MKKPIKRYDFDYEVVSSYFIHHVGCGKTLSARLVEKMDFHLGKFYTFLPVSIRIDSLYDFSMGNVLYNETPLPISIHLECSEFVNKFLKIHKDNCAIISDFMLEPTSKFVIKNIKMTPYKEEVYYFLNKDNSVQDVRETIKRASQVWHTLIVLTSLENGNEITSLDDELIDKICDNAKYVIAGAYDGDAYMFWERSFDPQKLKLN